MRIRKRQQAGPSEPETQKQEDRQEVNGQAVPAEQVEPADPAATVEPEVVEIDRAYLLQQEVEELKLKMQQTLAEAQNMRKRTLLQMEDARKYAAEPLVKELLKVCDSFSRAIASAEANPSLNLFWMASRRWSDNSLRPSRPLRWSAFHPSARLLTPAFTTRSTWSTRTNTRTRRWSPSCRRVTACTEGSCAPPK